MELSDEKIRELVQNFTRQNNMHLGPAGQMVVIATGQARVKSNNGNAIIQERKPS